MSQASDSTDNVKVWACNAKQEVVVRKSIHPMKTFRIWKSTGEPENIKANRVEFKRSADGLDVNLFVGIRKEIHRSGVIALTEIMPPRVVETR